MNRAFLRRDKGPLVQIGNDLKGCIIVTQTPEGQVSVAADGLSITEEIQALERALDFAKSKRTWKQIQKERKTDPNDKSVTIETWSFETLAQSQHFALQMALAGLPIQNKKVQS